MKHASNTAGQLPRALAPAHVGGCWSCLDRRGEKSRIACAFAAAIASNKKPKQVFSLILRCRAFAVSLLQRFPSSSAASPGASIGAGACAFEAVVSATNTHPSMKACAHSRTRLLDKTIGVRVIGEGDTDVDPAAASSTERGE